MEGAQTSTVAAIDTEHEDMIHDAQMDYYGKRLATCSSDRTVKIFEVLESNAHKLLQRLEGFVCSHLPPLTHSLTHSLLHSRTHPLTPQAHRSGLAGGLGASQVWTPSCLCFLRQIRHHLEGGWESMATELQVPWT
eukprot:m.28803 g.28803  ORF g.28803 m.28803 type:complete len:136 (+) comp40336_c0_seq2:116-523(+)